MLLKRDVFERLGGFDESIPMYLDDIDMCYRSNEIGLKNVYFPEAEIIHVGGHSVGKAYNRKMYDVLAMQAHSFYYRKHFGLKKVIFYKLIILSSIPYLLTLDALSLPYFILRNRINERIWVIKKHLKYFELILL